MGKGFAVSISLVLLLSSGTFGAIDQTQQFNVGAINTGSLTGGATGAIASFNLVPITNVQETSLGDGLQYMQVGVGSLFQGATAGGLFGQYGFDQGASATGVQQQTSPSVYILGAQGQDMGTVLMQNIAGTGNLGSAVAVQNFIGGQTQLATAPYGVQVNAQVLGVGVLDGLGGHVADVINRGFVLNRSMQVR
jgi:hypothetical protein